MPVSVAVSTGKIIHLHNMRYTCKEIGKELGISSVAVYKRLYRRGIQVNLGRSKFNQDYFAKIDTEQKAYWLGFIFADGCVLDCKYKNKRLLALRIGLSSIDKDHLSRFLEHIGSKNSMCLCNKGTECRISLNSRRLVLDLGRLGCVPRKSLILKYPSIAKRLDRHFIRGYFDGDGSICFQGKNARLSLVGTEDVLTVIHHRFSQNSIKMSVPKLRGNIYVIEGNGNRKAASLAKYFYQDASIYLSRKKEKFDAIL